LTHEFHSSLTIAHGGRFITIGRAQESVLEGLKSEQFLELFARLNERGIGKGACP